MVIFEWVVGVLLGAVLLAALARRVGAPYPAFLALGGVALAFVPGVPNLKLDPELALALFLAPVLLDAGYDTSLRDLRANWRPIGGLALGAVAVTTVAVAVVAKAVVPEMPFAACVVLGAVVAPPDAVAALSVLRHVPLPHRLTTILRGESLLNDAGSLLIYRLAVAAAITGSFHPGEIAPTFLLGVVGSLVAGPVLAFVYVAVMRLFADAASVIVLQFVAAFGIWIAAEGLEMSGVLTVVSFAITVARFSPGITPPRTRILSYAVWDTAVFVLNVLAFVLIGIQIGPILDRLNEAEQTTALILAGMVFLTVVLVRIAWVLPASGLDRLEFASHRRPRPGTSDAALGLKAALALSWSGMRGIVTIAAALALPQGGENGGFPYRDLIVFTAFCVVIGTLVIQGLTLGPLLARLGLEDDDPVGREVGRARAEAYAAALDSLDPQESESTAALRQEFVAALKEAKTHEEGLAPETLPADDARRRAISAARDRVLALRREGGIGDDAYYVLEEEFDWAELNVTPRAET
ncbi:cation:proton antiporter [Methylobacterium oxalidis]|uniref:Sodium:proton antiporter n=1 Tax=Methylobacterium oxalidis TaxID=944322 RepID=A0A512IYL0_9HYPH|nr:sodium:proton antiporter [Methylobacterium oxalidis]GEP02785.1 sodium:proton antiporter [Methylobacterium oxalidis]GJE34278.1 Sodium, potassium, lithium and rubidium/H(+) antiporter [Methylobacterium oxalidis]GLS66815.1 sodium:proton antiporter [Methylobacterium oxalidis]